MTYSGTKFEVATSNRLGGDTFTRNVTDARTDRRTTDRLWYKINIPFFSKEKSGYNKRLGMGPYQTLVIGRKGPESP